MTILMQKLNARNRLEVVIAAQALSEGEQNGALKTTPGTSVISRDRSGAERHFGLDTVRAETYGAVCAGERVCSFPFAFLGISLRTSPTFDLRSSISLWRSAGRTKRQEIETPYSPSFLHLKPSGQAPRTTHPPASEVRVALSVRAAATRGSLADPGELKKRLRLTRKIVSADHVGRLPQLPVPNARYSNRPRVPIGIRNPT